MLAESIIIVILLGLLIVITLKTQRPDYLVFMVPLLTIPIFYLLAAMIKKVFSLSSSYLFLGATLLVLLLALARLHLSSSYLFLGATLLGLVVALTSYFLNSRYVVGKTARIGYVVLGVVLNFGIAIAYLVNLA